MAKQALSDLTVVEFGDFISAPYCGKLLGDLGAKVIKVERPDKGDSSRQSGPFVKDSPNPEGSGLFLYLNTSKMGITLNVESSTGLALFKELLKRADILIENNPPKRMKQLGLDYASLKKVNPGLIMTSITPFGQTGPYRDYKGTDLICFHMGGLGYTTPRAVEDIAKDNPLKAGGRQADFLSGMIASVATMCAVTERGATGKGQHVDVSEQECVALLLQRVVPIYTYTGKIIERSGEALAGFAAMVPCRNGYFCFEPALDHQWLALAEVMGNPEWATGEMCRTRPARIKNWDMLLARLSEWTANYDKEQIWEMVQAKRVPGMPVNGMDDILKSDQLASRGFFVDIEHPATGKLMYPGAPYKFSETPWKPASPAPLLGEHNEEILCGRLGRPKQELAALKQAGVI